MEVNSQRYIRTGDKITIKKSNQTAIVHYIVNTKNQMSFDEPVGKITKLLVYCGDKIEHLFPKDIILN